MKKLIKIGLVVSLLTPLSAYAVFQKTQDLINGVGDLIGLLTPIVVALALLYFFWGLAKFILRAGDENAREEGKQIMIWGIIALFVMVSIWGIVNFLANDFGVAGGAMPNWAGPNCPDGSQVCT